VLPGVEITEAQAGVVRALRSRPVAGNCRGARFAWIPNDLDGQRPARLVERKRIRAEVIAMTASLVL
jgi:hypothetical protein